MSKKTTSEVIVGLDIGTSKVLAVVAEVNDSDELEVLGVGQHPSRGLRKGVVANIDSTVQSIQLAIEDAELTAECRISSVYAGIAGAHINSMNSHGVAAIKNRDEVGAEDVERVLEAAQAQAIPNDQRVLHILPQDFIIDGQEGIREPIGMSGVRLEAKVHIITGAVSAAQNIVKCITRCGLEVEDMVLEQIASSYAVLDEDEKELGVCLVDIGGGTTDIAVFTDGAIRHTAVLPIAGDQVTNDIAVALRTPTQAAEELKKKYGSALVQLAPEGEMIDTPSVGERAPRKLARTTLADVIEPRVEELFLLVQAELRRSGFEELLGTGIVLTGGSAKLTGMVDLAEEIFHMPVRLGVPKYVGALSDVVRNSSFSTAMGLLMFGHRHQSNHYPKRRFGVSPPSAIFGRMKQWFSRHLGEESQ
ncbi:MAG: cell division protein FtsA [Proteobacteria bacterium]|jgi:cell division protein FtsA|nr:cell division protein FtsA [Pseudomonadota bacterium]MBT4356461.1 cell division protein FtsA [Pseudomonadota bacterium]MBT4986194.1 cell division protein FtsA [Pseudomonadota bacterium]MBT5190012.1 cell division protein FtsA [Pseudomonadota bacterium]MBT5625869.1 cell division protein FtsA [Pseudomonadota bacterium]